MGWRLIKLYLVLLLIRVKKLRSRILVSFLRDSVKLSFFIDNYRAGIFLKDSRLALHKKWGILNSMWLITKIVSCWLIYYWIAQMPMIFLQLSNGVNKCTWEFTVVSIGNKVVILKSRFDVKNSDLRSRSRPWRHILSIFIFRVKITKLVRNLSNFNLFLLVFSPLQEHISFLILRLFIVITSNGNIGLFINHDASLIIQKILLLKVSASGILLSKWFFSD